MITLFATIIALSKSFAPETVHSKSFVAPSPSLASILVIFIITIYNACLKISKSAFDSVISMFSANPFDISATISLVDWSPSTDKQLYVIFTTSLRAFWSISLETAQSVVMKFKVVAILG